MFYHIEGVLAYKDMSTAVIDCGGVGYKMIISAAAAALLPDAGKKVKLFTHLIVRNEVVELLGFIDLAEKNAFLMLLTVSGVGIKAAMSVLSALGAERFAFAVAAGDYKEIAIAHGVSSKTAQKIIIELKDKITKEHPYADSDIGKGSAATLPSGGVSGKKRDAVNALIVLGYSGSDANAALDGIDLSLPLEAVLKAALKKLSKY